jgi:hypothetical protein
MASRIALAVSALLAACAPAAEELAVDPCLLQEYLQECESELATPQEVAVCRQRAPLEATRLRAGVQAECRTRGD